MLKILLESLLLEIAENGLNADEEINYLYETLNNNFTTDLQKEIKATNTGIQELKLMAYEIVNSEEFKEELQDLNITIKEDPKTTEVKEQYSEVIKELQNNDSNATYDEILKDNGNNIINAVAELESLLYNLFQEVEEQEEKEFYYRLWNTVNVIQITLNE